MNQVTLLSRHHRFKIRVLRAEADHVTSRSVTETLLNIYEYVRVSGEKICFFLS